MSTSWGYHCDTCDSDSPTWFNHGESTLIEAAAKWPGIKAALSLNLDNFDLAILPYLYEERSESEPSLFEFLAAHEGHRLCLKNEYGDSKPLEPERSKVPA